MFYRDPFGSVLIWMGIAPLVLLLGLAATAPIPIIGRLVSSVLAVALILVTRRTLPIGVEVNSEGIRLAGTWSRRSIPWRDIRQFGKRPWLLYAFVVVQLQTGAWVLVPVMQGRKMRWDAGETRDILGVLNDKLAAAMSTSHNQAA